MSAPDPTVSCYPTLGESALSYATFELAAGVKEEGGNNRGKRVEEYLAAAGGEAGEAWCASFVYWCFREACKQARIINPCPRTRGAIKLWTLADPVCHALAPDRGRVFVLDHGRGLGHVGFVEEVLPSGRIVTVEGNTNAAGSRAGDRVAKHVWDPTQPQSERGAALVGFIDFGLAPTRAVE